MSNLTDALHRVLARSRGQAVPKRATSTLVADPDNTIGISTIKIVTEEHIQAIAFGKIGSPPNAIVRLNPLSRDVTDLIPFAEFMIDWAERVQASGGCGRIWVPHSDTIDAMDILGHRYWRNQTAPPEVVRMGEICRIVAQEARYPGQQLVADAQSVLSSHAVTGLTPVEEGHLGAQLAWFDPAVSNPLMESRRRIRIPASGVLPNTPDQPMDDRVDRLRKEAKSAQGDEKLSVETEISGILFGGR